MLTGPPRAPGYRRENVLRNGASRQLSRPRRSTNSQLVLCGHTGAINHRAVAYRILSRPSTSARLFFCLAPRLHADLAVG